MVDVFIWVVCCCYISFDWDFVIYYIIYEIVNLVDLEIFFVFMWSVYFYGFNVDWDCWVGIVIIY